MLDVKSVRAGVDEVAVVRRYALAEKHNWEGVRHASEALRLPPSNDVELIGARVIFTLPSMLVGDLSPTNGAGSRGSRLLRLLSCVRAMEPGWALCTGRCTARSPGRWRG
jgi:hypothetical protein